MTTSDGPGPGWYDDGVTPDVERWFDGHGWTEHTRPLPAPAAPPAPPAPVVGGTTWAPAGPVLADVAAAAPGAHAAPAAHHGGVAPLGTAAPVAVASPWSTPASSWGTGVPSTRSSARPPTAALPWAPVPYASWVLRVAAYLLDTLALVPWGLAYAYAMLTATPGTDVYGTPALQPTPTGTTVLLVGVLVTWVLYIANRWVLPARTGQSLGKRAVGIRVRSEQTGTTLSVWMCLVRDFAHALDSLVLYLGYLWPLWDAKRQTFADKAVKAVVVRDV
ncbi:DUF2510 domain-containing protein [Cellulomonas sp. JZ18]|uniref:RDD family protein n=1 Tax=Cellulomonas sp. JZ18 TaxID=2654191 RepID=UPI0012D4B315|nr:RDD family protein [Cellulomonas sp. JZ18]QGQ18067.1 DUF2510 domain-containing protein [Cellulomonas sp. JZ18]